MSWITGLRPSELGITKNEDKSLCKDAPSIVRKLRDAGWHTVLVGKTHWTSHRSATDLRDNNEIIEGLGFKDVTEIAGPRALRYIKCELTDEWNKKGFYEVYKEDMNNRYSKKNKRKAWTVRPTVLPEELYPDIWLTNKAIDKIKTLPTSKPWLLWVSYVGPHEPFDTPNNWRKHYKKLENSHKILDQEKVEKLPECELKTSYKKWKDKLTTSEINCLRQDYASKLELLDRQVGRIIKELEKREDKNKTKVLVVADHGEMLGDYGMLYKATFLDGAIKVPFILADLAIKKGRRIYSAIELTDAMKKVINLIHDDQDITKMIKWARRSKGAIIEYGKERMYIMGKYRVTLDISGSKLWGSKSNRRSQNQSIENIAEDDRILKEKKWMRLLIWAERMNRKLNSKARRTSKSHLYE